MNDKTAQIQAIPGVPTSRRSLAFVALLNLADDLLTARFALSRAVAELTTEQLLQVLDEVDETLGGPSRQLGLYEVTQRDENCGHTE